VIVLLTKDAGAIRAFEPHLVTFLPPEARPMPSCGVCLSVTFVSCVKTNKHIIKKFSQSGSHAILVFHAQRLSNIPTGTPLLGASNAGGVGRNRDSKPISSLTACVNAATGYVL